jgi:RNA polymerase sigma-32 factor
MDWLADDKPEGTQETRLADSEEFGARMSLLEDAMTDLSDRERHIIRERRLKDDPATLEDLSKEYGVSRERVRQIEVRAFEKLQKAMKAQAASRGLVAEDA